MVSPVSLAQVGSNLTEGIKGLQQGAESAAAASAAGQGFAEQLGQMAGDAFSSLRAGEVSAIGALNGTVPAQETVTQIMQAERQLQHAIAVRDKLVSAYVDLSRMQI